jgi:hypothetical protein
VAAVRPRRPELLPMHLAATCVTAGRGLTDEAEAHASAAEEVAANLKYGQQMVYSAMARALCYQAAGDYVGMADAQGPFVDRPDRS